MFALPVISADGLRLLKTAMDASLPDTYSEWQPTVGGLARQSKGERCAYITLQPAEFVAFAANAGRSLDVARCSISSRSIRGATRTKFIHTP
jgi:hypothetical protein